MALSPWASGREVRGVAFAVVCREFCELSCGENAKIIDEEIFRGRYIWSAHEFGAYYPHMLVRPAWQKPHKKILRPIASRKFRCCADSTVGGTRDRFRKRLHRSRLWDILRYSALWLPHKPLWMLFSPCFCWVFRCFSPTRCPEGVLPVKTRACGRDHSQNKRSFIPRTIHLWFVEAQENVVISDGICVSKHEMKH